LLPQPAESSGFACLQLVHHRGGHRVAGDTPLALGHFFDLDPGHGAQGLTFDFDHGVGQLGDHGDFSSSVKTFSIRFTVIKGISVAPVSGSG